MPITGEMLIGALAVGPTQLRQFASVIRRGSFLRATIDPAEPDRQPREARRNKAEPAIVARLERRVLKTESHN